nr:amiloride-sensitive amine oxidase [copper-containing]-like isoform X2 [Nerophis lumbriciformis]
MLLFRRSGAWTSFISKAMRLLCLLLVASLAGSKASRTREWAHHGAPMFADLTVREMKAVREYLHAIPHLGLTDVDNMSLKKNSILMMELHVPKKHEALRALDRGHAKPPRQARVIVQFGNQTRPNITEFIVSPLPSPKSHEVKRFKGDRPIRFESRPVTAVESHHLGVMVEKIAIKAHKILFETTGGFMFKINCSEHCLMFVDIAPRGLSSGERRSWIMMVKYIEGHYIHPIGFEFLVNHKDLDPNLWMVEKVWYNSKYFDSVEELVEKYESGAVEKVTLPPHDDEDLYSTFTPRSPSSTNTQGPKVVEPQGHRYHIDGNFVEYAGWSFAYGVRSSAGLQVFDLRFNGERIAYEVSLQEAIAFYSGHTPAAMQTKYIDAGWAMGTLAFELAPGIDCPAISTFVDLHHFYDSNKPVLYKNALCVFETTTALPLRRHFDDNFRGGYTFYGGLDSTVLVLRTTSTVYNYDYIWDFIFYQNGVMEVKVSATGYIHATFFTPEGLQYGNKVYDYVLGNLHTHLIHYKVDLDVAGRENSFQSMGLKFVNFTNPWSPKDTIVQSKLHWTEHKTERSAAFRFGKKFPRYVLFSNPKQKNKWGHEKGYRIQMNSHADSVLPRGWREENGITWSRYPLAVTRHKDNEPTSSSIYNQNDPWKPVVNFEDFIRNNENIVNQDLVAWVTVGFLHVPHSEDVPNTATPGNAVGFFLRPFNFFDEDPSVASRSTVIVRPGKDGRPDVQRWTPEVKDLCVTDQAFFFNGSHTEV